jgi:HptB-dependent secretion and biofilm anti anti-sigma factor
MTYAVHNENNATIIQLHGKFTFESHKDFRLAADQALARQETRCLILDMREVEYLDSAALGMLLLLKEKAESAAKTIQIKNPQGIAQQVLEVANFHKLFTILA